MGGSPHAIFLMEGGVHLTNFLVFFLATSHVIFFNWGWGVGGSLMFVILAFLGGPNSVVLAFIFGHLPHVFFLMGGSTSLDFLNGGGGPPHAIY